MSAAVPEEQRLVDGGFGTDDLPEASLRPQTLDAFIGQSETIDNLRVFIEAARGRSEALDHVLLYGPPGLGKTTLAQIVARALGVSFRATSGPVVAQFSTGWAARRHCRVMNRLTVSCARSSTFPATLLSKSRSVRMPESLPR